MSDIWVPAITVSLSTGNRFQVAKSRSRAGEKKGISEVLSCQELRPRFFMSVYQNFSVLLSQSLLWSPLFACSVHQLDTSYKLATRPCRCKTSFWEKVAPHICQAMLPDAKSDMLWLWGKLGTFYFFRRFCQSGEHCFRDDADWWRSEHPKKTLWMSSIISLITFEKSCHYFQPWHVWCSMIPVQSSLSSLSFFCCINIMSIDLAMKN